MKCPFILSTRIALSSKIDVISNKLSLLLGNILICQLLSLFYHIMCLGLLNYYSTMLKIDVHQLATMDFQY